MKALILTLILASCGFSQAVRFDQISSTTNSACASGALCPVLAIPGTTVNVCNGSQSTLAGCNSNLATTYTSASAGTPCATTSQLTPQTGGACRSTSDNQGNYGFWLLPGQYSYYLTIPRTAGGGSYGPYPISVGASAGCPLGYAACDANYNTLQAAVTAAGGGALYVTKTWSLSSTVTASANGLSIICNENAVIRATTGSFPLLISTGANQSVSGCNFNANSQSNIVGILHTTAGNFSATWNTFTGNNTFDTGITDICIVSCGGGGAPVTGVYLGHNRHINTYQGDVVWDADAVEIDGEYATGLTGDGIYNNTDLGTFTNGASFVAHDWVFQNMHRYCEEIAGNGMATWKITNNHCETTGGGAGGISGGSDNSGGSTDQLIGGVISGNTMLGVGTPTGGSLGIEVYGKNWTVADNKVSGAFETGILYGVCNTTFRGNSFTGLGINGVEGQGMQQNFTFILNSCSPTGGGNNVFTENTCINVLHICISAGLTGDIVSNNNDSRAPGFWASDASPGVGYLSFLNNGGGLSTGQPTVFSNNALSLLAPVNGFSLSSPGSFTWSAFYSNSANPILYTSNTVTNRNATRFGTSFDNNNSSHLNALETGNISTNVTTINAGGTSLSPFIGGIGQNFSLIGLGSGTPALDFTINANSLPVTVTKGAAVDTGTVVLNTALGFTSTPYNFWVDVTPAGTPASSQPLFTVNVPSGVWPNVPVCTLQGVNTSAQSVIATALYAPGQSSTTAIVFYAGTTIIPAGSYTFAGHCSYQQVF